jgi:hypothetical protein
VIFEELRVKANTVIFFSTIYFLFIPVILCGDDAPDENILKGRDISPLPDTDERINGYRKDYKKVKGNHIQLPSKYTAKKTEPVLNEVPAPPEVKNEVPEIIEKPAQKEAAKPVAGYTGETVNGVRDGKGKLVLENGDIYEGNWKNGKKSGHGIYLYLSGLKYNGNWEDDRMDGAGSLIFPDGSLYYGDFSKGTITGAGTFRYSDGAVYEGGWKNGKWNGKGVFRLPDGRMLNAIFADHQVIEILKEEKTGNESEVEKNDENN